MLPGIKVGGNGAAELKKLREEFAGVSVEMIAMGKVVGIPAESVPVRIMHCPMGSRYDWLQTGAETVNPYMGKEMLACGNAVEALPRVAASVATRARSAGTRLLAVPRSAVIDTGARKLVYVADAEAEGVFNLREVKVGMMGKDVKTGGEFYPVLSGLKETERVVTTGAFLLDAENRLSGAAEDVETRMPGMEHRNDEFTNDK
jgi:hypothetical protein